jgi:hypothetical protein
MTSRSGGLTEREATPSQAPPSMTLQKQVSHTKLTCGT